MAEIEGFERLLSKVRFVRLGTGLRNAATNAANDEGPRPVLVDRYVEWPRVTEFNNDNVPAGSPSPFANRGTPDYLWGDETAEEGEIYYFGIASNPFTVRAGEEVDFSAFLSAFADNAMEAVIVLFRERDGRYVPVDPQPTGLGGFILRAGEPGNPGAGLTETAPYAWQNVRYYSTDFTVDQRGRYKVAVAFKGTNYELPAEGTVNPAAIQFVVDLYITPPED